MAISLVSFDDVKTLLGLVKTESDYPDLEIIKDSVVAMFENYTGRKFEEGTYIEEIEVFCPTRMIPLDALPVRSMTSVKSGGVTVKAVKSVYGAKLELPLDDTTIEVTYIGGLTDIPTDLERAALLQTAYEYQNKQSIGLEFVSTDGGSVTKPQLGMLKEVKTLLNQYKHPFPVF